MNMTAQDVRSNIHALQDEMTRWRASGHAKRWPDKYTAMLATTNKLNRVLAHMQDDNNLSLHGLGRHKSRAPVAENVTSVGNYYTIPGGAAQYYAAGVVLPPGTVIAADPNVPQFGQTGVAYNPSAQPGQPGFNPFGQAQGVSTGGYYLIPPSTTPAYYPAGAPIPAGAQPMGAYSSFTPQAPDPQGAAYNYAAASSQYAPAPQGGDSIPQAQLSYQTPGASLSQPSESLINSVYADMDGSGYDQLSGFFGELSLPPAKRAQPSVVTPGVGKTISPAVFGCLLIGAWLLSDMARHGKRGRR